jgi:hypothetical protein
MVNIKEVLESQGYKNIKIRLLISIFILIIAIIVVVIIYVFLMPRQCQDSNCFSQALTTCRRVYFIKEDSSAAWYYEIKGSSGKDSCTVTVKLLKINQGTIDIESLEGSQMNCMVNKAETLAPEENMKSCTGLLKEKLQEIIIDRMHSYLLKNLGDIKESFSPNNLSGV